MLCLLSASSLPGDDAKRNLPFRSARSIGIRDLPACCRGRARTSKARPVVESTQIRDEERIRGEISRGAARLSGTAIRLGRLHPEEPLLLRPRAPPGAGGGWSRIVPALRGL